MRLVNLWQRREEITWVVLGQAFAFVGSVLTVKSFTNVLTPAEYGELALALSLGAILNTLVQGPFGNSIGRFLSEARAQGNLASYFGALRSTIATAALASVILAAVSFFPAVGFFSWTWACLILLGILFGASGGILGNLACYLAANRERKMFAINQAGVIWARFGAGMLFVWGFGSRGLIALAGYIVADILNILGLRRHFVRAEKAAIATTGTAVSAEKMRREWLRYAWPFSLWGLFTAASMHFDRWYLQHAFGADAVGKYVIMNQIANVPTTLIGAVLMQLIGPIVYERAASKAGSRAATRLVYAVGTLSVVGFSLVTLLFYFFAPQFVRLLSRDAYESDASLLWILTAALSLFQVAQLMTLVGHVHKRIKGYIGAFIVKSVLTIVLCCQLGKTSGAYGLAEAILISNIGYFLYVLVLNQSFEENFFGRIMGKFQQRLFARLRN